MALDADLFDPEIKQVESLLLTPQVVQESIQVQDLSSGGKTKNLPKLCPPFKHTHDNSGNIFIRVEDLPDRLKSILKDPEVLCNFSLDPEAPNQLNSYPPEIKGQIQKMALDYTLANPYDKNIPDEIDLTAEVCKWIWGMPPVTRVVLFASVVSWLVSAIPIDVEYKPTLCCSYFQRELTATGSALIALKVVFWSFDCRSSFISTISGIVLNREFKALEKRRGSIYAFVILCAIWICELTAFLLMAFLSGSFPYKLCLFGQMGLVFGVKQIQNAVHPREEKNFLCSNLYFPAFFHMFVGAALWQLVVLGLVGTFDLSVFLGLFTGVIINISPSFRRLCKGRMHGLEKKECFWLAKSSGYVSANDSEVIIPRTRHVSKSQLRCRTPQRENSSDSQNEETTHLLIDTVS